MQLTLATELSAANSELLQLRREIYHLLRSGGELVSLDRHAVESALERSLSLSRQLGVAHSGGYELLEFERDRMLLREGEEALWQSIAKEHGGEPFLELVGSIAAQLGGQAIHHWVSDRDGTVSNYAARYRGSYQPLYNALVLGRFARSRIGGLAAILTSAPLRDGGLCDLSLLDESEIFFAGSRGRERLDHTGRFEQDPLPEPGAGLLNSLYEQIVLLLESHEFQLHYEIGSGLQRKHGQITLARQDVSGTIPSERSEALLKRVDELMRQLDPSGGHLALDDTGRDIEISLTVSGRDYDKGDGIRSIYAAFESRPVSDRLNPFYQPGQPACDLICGDTEADLSMLPVGIELAAREGRSIEALFVDQSALLRFELERLTQTGSPFGYYTVPHCDYLVAILRSLSH